MKGYVVGGTMVNTKALRISEEFELRALNGVWCEMKLEPEETRP